MWPSMIRSEAHKNVKDKARQLMQIFGVEDEPDGHRGLLDDHGDDSLMKDEDDEDIEFDPDANEEMVAELRALEKWLDGDDNALVAHFGSMDLGDVQPATSTSFPISVSTDGNSSETVSDGSVGFDDDFTDFLSAEQPSSAASESSFSSLQDEYWPPFYSFLDSDYEDDEDDEDEDDLEIPSEKDVQETANVLLGLPRGSAAGTGEGQGEHVDLNNVFNTVQGYRDQIAKMVDDDERRRTAARVALGLVYGLPASS